jgi:Holliday junction resolvase
VSRAKKVDSNQADIVAALEKAGCSVVVCAQGEGFPDLICGLRGANWLLEVKSKKGKLNDRQVRWHRDWRGQVSVVRTVEQALQAVGCVSN